MYSPLIYYTIFSYQMRFDLNIGFPLLTVKRVFFKGMVDELLWFLSGSTNAFDLPERTQKWWTPWAKPDGDLGPIYGYQLRTCGNNLGKQNEIDQIQNVITQIKSNPNSRRHVMTTWSPCEINLMQLAPCHGTVIQFYVANGRLSCSMYQRSCDVFVGCPVNIACYSLLTHMIAQVCGLEVGEFIHTLGDAHLYLNHIDASIEMVKRELRPQPTILLNKAIDNIDNFKENDIVLLRYNPHPAIKVEVAI